MFSGFDSAVCVTDVSSLHHNGAGRPPNSGLSDLACRVELDGVVGSVRWRSRGEFDGYSVCTRSCGSVWDKYHTMTVSVQALEVQ